MTFEAESEYLYIKKIEELEAEINSHEVRRILYRTELTRLTESLNLRECLIRELKVEIQQLHDQLHPTFPFGRPVICPICLQQKKVGGYMKRVEPKVYVCMGECLDIYNKKHKTK